MSRRSLIPTAFSVFLEQQENHKEKREGTREWLIFFSRFPTITSHQALGDYNFQAFNSAFTSCSSSSGFGGLWFVCGASRGRELRVRTAFSESFSRSTCKSDEWLSASHQRFFFFLQFDLHKKQAGIFCLQKYVWVGVYTRARENTVKGDEGGSGEKAQTMLVPSFKLHLGFFFIRKPCFIKTLLEFLIF